MDRERLTDFRNTPWTERGWTVWQRGDSEARKQKVWRLHKEYDLHGELRDAISVWGKPDAVMIRRRR